MIYYILRHKQSGKVMPQMKTGKGYSYWLYDNIFDNHLPIPRLFASEKQAKKAVVEWAKGVYKWVDVVSSDGPLFLPDQKRKLFPQGRSKDDIEIIPVLIQLHPTFLP